MSTVRVLGLSAFAAVVIAAAACGDDDEGAAPPPDNEAGADASTDGRPPPTPSEFGLDTRPSNKTCKAPARPPTTAPVTFQQVYANLGNLGAPMMLAQRPGDGSRWYLARRNGTLAHFPSQNPTALTTAANINPANPNPVAGVPGLEQGGEGGFLGIAFHPKFAQNGKLYISFTAPPRANPTIPGSTMQSIIGELTTTNGGDTFTAYKQILAFDNSAQGGRNHKGGGIAFGKDGYLYASWGDGGGGDDPDAQGQTKNGFFSKVIRIDVDNPAGGNQYGIPNDNPFKNGGGQPEVYAYGFRNPFRISIDRESGDLWVGDVGQNKWEEIDQAKLGGNYGWPCKEGTHEYITTANKCPSKIGLLDPIVEHEHVPAGTRSITGGVVYRGKAVPLISGAYVYGDYEALDLHLAQLDPGTGTWKSTLINPQNPRVNWVDFAEDVDGEVYGVALNQGSIYKLVAAGPQPPDTFPTLLSQTGCVDPADAKKPAEGLIPYTVNAQLWSDGADKERFIALPDGQTITVNAEGDFELPVGSVVVKSFKIGGKLIETRLLVRHDDGGWAGYTYEWNDAQTDATLLRGSKTKTVGSQNWYFPSRGDCARCHTDAAGKTLGLEIGQLNGDFVYESTNRISNQLKTLEHIGMFAASLGKPPAELAVIPAVDGSAGLEQRARGYLHSNCSMCHRPQGGGAGNLDLRFTTALKDTASCNVNGERGDLGVAGAKILVPGDATKSLLSIRARTTGGNANRMPPLASSVVDDKGVGVVDDWIKSLTACP